MKYKLYEFENDGLRVIKEDLYEQISSYDDTVKMILREIGNLQEISAIGHRVVHGGGAFFQPLIVGSKELEELKKLNGLAPLHNPYNLMGIEAVSGFLPETPQVAVFDTAFFSDLPDVTRLYGINPGLAEEFGIRRYGFHGISHEYALQQASLKLEKRIEDISLISLHLGGGWSAAAVRNGKPLDISMGWTPMEGLMMMTRSGDIDPGIIFCILEERISEIVSNAGSIQECLEVVNNLKDILNKKSGISAFSGADDYIEVLQAVNSGDGRAKSAFDMAVYRLVKYIGAYWAVLEGKADAIVFTGRIGAGDPRTRESVMKKFKFLGEIPVLAIAPDEEKLIAEKTHTLIMRKKRF